MSLKSQDGGLDNGRNLDTCESNGGVLVTDNGKMVPVVSQQFCNHPLQCVCYQIHVSGGKMERGRASLCSMLSTHQMWKGV